MTWLYDLIAVWYIWIVLGVSLLVYNKALCVAAEAGCWSRARKYGAVAIVVAIYPSAALVVLWLALR